MDCHSIMLCPEQLLDDWEVFPLKQLVELRTDRVSGNSERAASRTRRSHGRWTAQPVGIYNLRGLGEDL